MTANLPAPARPAGPPAAQPGAAPQAAPGAEAAADAVRDAGLLPADKATIIMAALGPDIAPLVLQGMNEGAIRRFAQAMSRLNRVSPEVLDHVVMEFVRELGGDNAVKGGIGETRKILSNLLDKDSVSRIMDDVDLGGRTLWEKLSNCSDQALAGFLRHEHPQTAAVVLSKMRSDKAARILERLDPEFAQIIVLRLARVPRLDAEVVAILKEVIGRDFLSVMQREQATRRPADVIGSMMTNVSSANRARLLKHLEAERPKLARQVQKVMFTYADLVERLDPKDVGTLLKGVEEATLLMAVKMAETNAPRVTNFFMNNLPKRMAQRLLGEVQQLGEVKPKEGEAAQAEVVRVARELAAAGEITLIESDEEE